MSMGFEDPVVSDLPTIVSDLPTVVWGFMYCHKNHSYHFNAMPCTCHSSFKLLDVIKFTRFHHVFKKIGLTKFFQKKSK